MKVTLKMIFYKWLFFLLLLLMYNIFVLKESPIPAISLIMIYILFFGPIMFSEELQQRGDMKKEKA